MIDNIIGGVLIMKKSKYANVVKQGNKALIHNTLFGGIIKANCDDSRTFLESVDTAHHFDIDESNDFHKILKDMRMVVDDGMDESSLVNLHYFERQQVELNIIPFVTKQCNFRCVYCYENHTNDKMQPETYESLLKCIENLVDAKGYKVINLSFFGGEPMLEYEAITVFAQKINELAERKNIIFNGSMTTNAYLLTFEKLKKLMDLNIRSYQITIDGLKETHDKARFLINKGGTWDKIIRNLQDAKNSDLRFRITLRTNISDEIMKSAKEFIEFMAQKFGSDERFSFHCEAVKKLRYIENDPLEVIDDESDAVNELSMYAKSLGLSIAGLTSFTKPFGLVCYAAKNDSFSIDYDGTVMKCTVHIEDEANKIGKLSDGNLNIEDHLMAPWTSKDLAEQCRSCAILPMCYGRKCPAINQPDDYCDGIIQMYQNTLRNLL